jgi:hypothetical protein
MIRKTIIASVIALAAGVAWASGAEEVGRIDALGINAVSIRSGSCDVRVTLGEWAEVSLDSNARIMHAREGSRLKVWVDGEGSLPFAFPARIQLTVPRGTDLEVETSSGSVSVDGLESRACTVHTVSGRIRFRHTRGRISADSVSGEILMETAEGSISARTISGEITGRSVQLTGDSSFSAVSGDIEIRLNTALEDLSLDLKSVSGNISVGAIRAPRGLRMGFGRIRVSGQTISGALSFQ